MPEFEYSPKALETLHLFHGVDFLIFVEGKEDIPYWVTVLEDLNINGFQILDVGKDRIDNLIEEIDDDESKIIYVRDADYSEIFNTQVDHERIIYTYGYSIENSLYCPKKISKAIANLAKTNKNYSKEIESWYDEFCNRCYEFLIYDLANEKFNKGISVMGRKAHRFLIRNRHPQLSKTKINKYIKEKKKQFTENEIKKIKKVLKAFENHKHLRYIIRGHFLTGPVINIIKKITENETGNIKVIPKDNLYTILVAKCHNCRKSCTEFNYLKKSFKNARKQFVID